MCSKGDSSILVVFENIEDRRLRHSYAHENHTLLEPSKLKCTKKELTKLNDFRTKVTSSSRVEKKKSKQSGVYKLAKLNVFASLLKDVPMGCKDAAFSEPLLKKKAESTVSCSNRLQDSRITTTCLFSCSCTPFERKSRVARRNFENLQLKIQSNWLTQPQSVQWVQMNGSPIIEDLLTLNIPLNEINIVDNNIIRELARRRVQKHEKILQLLRYNNQIR